MSDQDTKPAPFARQTETHHGQTAQPKISQKSTRTIVLYTFALFIPLVAFSIILLALVFRYKVGDEPSTGNEVPGGYYLVDFSATRLIFISSWSSSVAPKLVSVVTGLYLFLAAKAFIRDSAIETTGASTLPTPYQLALLVGLSTGSSTELWKYANYQTQSPRAKNVPILKRMGFMLILFQLLAYVPE
jgi:hypothetical protein